MPCSYNRAGWFYSVAWKNLKLFNGCPLIEWTIKAVKGAGNVINRVVVSTDCGKLRTFNESLGCDIPFYPSDNLSSDTAASIDVARHCIHHLETIENDEPYDWLLLLPANFPTKNFGRYSCRYGNSSERRSDVSNWNLRGDR